MIMHVEPINGNWAKEFDVEAVPRMGETVVVGDMEREVIAVSWALDEEDYDVSITVSND